MMPVDVGTTHELPALMAPASVLWIAPAMDMGPGAPTPSLVT